MRASARNKRGKNAEETKKKEKEGENNVVVVRRKDNKEGTQGAAGSIRWWGQGRPPGVHLIPPTCSTNITVEVETGQIYDESLGVVGVKKFIMSA